MTDPTSVHDAARERAVKLLTDGYAYDAISEEEFEWRLTQLGRARVPPPWTPWSLISCCRRWSPHRAGKWPPAGCSIEVAAIMANVSFIVAPGMSVDFDVSSVMASTRNDASVYLPEGFHLPQVRISGTAVMSEVRVRVRAPGR